MGLSNRKFAALAGVSEGAVRKARADRIASAILADGTIDPDRALALWGKHTDPAKQRKASPPAADTSAMDEPAVEGPTPKADGNMNKARSMLTAEKALRERIKRKKDELSVIDRSATIAATQTLAREFRDGLLGFPDMHYAQMASELLVDPVTGKVDPHSMYEVLSAHLRKHLEKSIEKIKVEVGQ